MLRCLQIALMGLGVILLSLIGYIIYLYLRFGL